MASGSMTSTVVPPPAVRTLAMGQGMVAKELTLLLMHQFEGAVGKAERLGRASGPQLAGWAASLGPTSATAKLLPLLFTATQRGLARRQRSTLGSRRCPLRSSCTPSESPPRGHGQTTTAAHRALPTGWRRSDGVSQPGPPPPLLPPPATAQASTTTSHKRQPVSLSTPYPPRPLTAIVS